jgi:hypothetical protein
MKAQVRHGRLVLDEPSDLPEGTEVELVPIDADELDDEDRRRLHQALAESEAEVAQGRVRPMADLLGELDSESAGGR